MMFATGRCIDRQAIRKLSVTKNYIYSLRLRASVVSITCKVSVEMDLMNGLVHEDKTFDRA
jgi:hypothetical protein